MRMKRNVASFMAATAIVAATHSWFDPLIETASAQGTAGSSATYQCNILRQVNYLCTASNVLDCNRINHVPWGAKGSPVRYVHDTNYAKASKYPYDVNSPNVTSFNVTVNWGPGSTPQFITLKSDFPDFDGKALNYLGAPHTSYGIVTDGTDFGSDTNNGTSAYFHSPNLFLGSIEWKGEKSFWYTAAMCPSFKSPPASPSASSTSNSGAAGSADIVRGVFIRPCEGDFYASFPKDRISTPTTNVADGTLSGACKDLHDSGVTDIFLPFKVDDEVYSHCGKAGDLLYKSAAFPQYINGKFKNAQAQGFDPIGALMNACLTTYNATASPLRFHAWFPTFSDRNAAAIGGLVGKPFLVNPLTPQQPVCKSSISADPANAAVRTYEMQLLRDIYANYPQINGINLDYIRYPDLAAFQAEVGATPGCTGASFDVKPDQVESFVRIVRDNFLNLTLSADVKAGAIARQSVGQDTILQDLKVIMPMTYTYFGLGGSSDVTKYVQQLGSGYPMTSIVPDLRGWKIADSSTQSLETSAQLITGLAGDISAAITGKASGYVIFTYESFVVQSGQTLSSSKNSLGF